MHVDLSTDLKTYMFAFKLFYLFISFSRITSLPLLQFLSGNTYFIEVSV